MTALQSVSVNLTAKPVIKWAGGKRQLLHELRKEIPTSYKHYYEPFFGGGALFFDLLPPKATIGDTNELLMRTYLGVRNDVEDVIQDLRKNYRYSEEAYYDERARHKHIVDKDYDSEVAAWFIYINRTCFNGLWRVNKAGRFNVPFGRYENPTICDAEGLRAASRALKGVNVRIESFEKTVRGAERGDLVYFDCPYCPVSSTSNFTQYTKNGFTIGDQGRLRDCAEHLKRLGVHVVLTNSDVPEIRSLYKNFSIRRVEANRNINSKATSRGPVGELVIT